MQAGEDDRVERVRLDPLLRQREQGRGAEVDGKARARAIDDDARLETAAASERVPRSHEAHADGHRARRWTPLRARAAAAGGPHDGESALRRRRMQSRVLEIIVEAVNVPLHA